MFNVEIISSGSHGNAVMIDDCILIDIGITYKHLKPYMEKADVVIITHAHGDHLKIETLRQYQKYHKWKVRNTVYANQTVADKIKDSHKNNFTFEVKLTNILKSHTLTNSDPYKYELRTKKGNYTLETFRLEHDTENQGLIITNEQGHSLIYATDTYTLEYAPDRIYDYMLLEGNYDEELWVEAIGSLDDNIIKRAMFNLNHLTNQNFEKFVTSHSHKDTKVWQLHISDTLGRKVTRVNIENKDN